MGRLAVEHSDAFDPGVSFVSSWRQLVSTSDGEVQTDAVEVAHVRVQHPKTKEEEMQSEAIAEMATAPLVRSGFQKLKELDAFLEVCTPLLEAQLHRNLTSHAFHGHEVAWEEQFDNVECLHSLKHTGTLATLSPDGCTAVAWNS